MKKFDFTSKFNNITKNKELVEISLHGAPTFKVAYVLGAAKEHLLFAEINSSALPNGITICQTSDIDFIALDTVYTSELVKRIEGASLFDQAVKEAKPIKKYTFEGFISAFENTKTIVEITTDEEVVYAGRIIGHDDKVLVLDEYSTESDKCLGHLYFNRSIISRLSIDVPWLRTIERSLADKNL